MVQLSAVALAGILESFASMAPPQIADVVSMELAQQRAYPGYRIDANPLFGADPDVKRVIAVKLGLTVVSSWGDHQIGKRSRPLQWTGRVLYYGGYAAAVYLNSRHRVGKTR